MLKLFHVIDFAYLAYNVYIINLSIFTIRATLAY